MALAISGGAIAALGQAPFDIWPATPLGLALVALSLVSAPGPKAAAWRGLAAGTAHFAVALHWIVEPFFVDAARHGWMAPFALVFFAVGLALFWAAPAALTACVARGRAPAHRAIAQAALFLALLALSEAARGVVLTGFPWAQPGHALIDTDYLMAAAWAGPQGLTLIVVATAAMIASLIVHAGRAPLAAAGALTAFVLPLLLPTPSGPVAGPGAPVVRLVQPNAPQDLKWREDMIPVFWERGLALTAAAPDPSLGAPGLVVWPETSLPVLLDRSDAARSRLAAAAGEAQVIVGGNRYEGLRPRNTLAQLAPGGAIVAVYDKHHLVPFGEYLPFEEVFDRLDLAALAAVVPGGYTSGPGPALLDLGEAFGRVFPMICYEAIFPGYIRDVGDRPDWLLHITNDAWFGTFSGPWQHLALARLRAAEQGLPVLRAANTGVSAVIDARGQVVSALGLGEAGHLDAALPPALPPTLYARTGDWPALLVTFLVALGAAIHVRREEAH
ncbi:apolipoprotein N-acyltransferase [Roseibacterium sp. SDUM158016]|uniref:apolipoprotein N-acyltransferase n=1 Tax=Roseicyclus sediminis TaxID=2980997 RepID=UPI0021CE4BAD|nr:apolipoprotein N-acyltransferase [Roseibacterium sp. SDUM158016]MCU4651323.1 apolipoprotein N-acyltransferase [Roseibacterium sp. SDUM158016]